VSLARSDVSLNALALASAASDDARMSAEENKALVRRFYEEVDAGNLAAMDDLVAEDYVNHHPPPFPGLSGGREGLKQAFQIFWDATPGRHEIEDQIADGDKVVTRLTAHGRHEGALPGPIPPTGKEIHMSAVAIHRIANGKLAEHWSGTDELGLLVQLGVVSLPQPPG
jgi:predicted ester cyclase